MTSEWVRRSAESQAIWEELEGHLAQVANDGLRATLKSYIHSFADARITDARINIAASRARRQAETDQQENHAFVGQGGDFECVLCGLPDDHTIHYRSAGPVD